MRSAKPKVPTRLLFLHPKQYRWLISGLIIAFAVCVSATTLAHPVEGGDAAFIRTTPGFAPVAFAYLGAKHMLTGYDHLLFLVGVIFYLQRLRDIAYLVSAFSLGHSITLLVGVSCGWGLNPALVDAIIGLSILYKAVDNLGGIRAFIRKAPAAAPIIFIFGLFHGLGLAESLLNLHPQGQWVWLNLVAFNIGVEVGQIIGLFVIYGLIILVRRLPGASFQNTAINWALSVAGLVIISEKLVAFQLSQS